MPASCSRLVTSAPSSIHFVLASRNRVRGLAQLRVEGEVLEISEEQLLLSGAEMLALAELHGVDPSVPTSTGGWPAAASVAAAYGIVGAEEYVFEAVLDHLDDDEREALAIATAVGGGDARPAAQCDRRGVTSIQWSCCPGSRSIGVSDGGEFMVHDLWRRVIGDGIGDEAGDAPSRDASTPWSSAANSIVRSACASRTQIGSTRRRC